MNPNYNNSLLLQQHLQQQQHQNPQQGGQQQQQQQQQPSMQPDQSMNQNNMDSARMQQWAQMRYGQNAGGDMNHAKFAEMMKRNHVANQLSRHQPSQPFAATAAMGHGMQQAQNGANILGGNPQQQSFHEQHPSNMTQQAHLPQAFPNMGAMSNGNANAAASASLQGRNPSGVLPNAQAARPLDMIGMVQQPQSTTVNANKFPQLQQSQLALRDSQQMQFPQSLNQGSPVDMFPDGIRRPSPHPVNAMQGSGLGQSVQVSHPGYMGAMLGRPQNIELSQRLHVIHAQIKTLEGQQANLIAHGATLRGNAPAEAQNNQKLNNVKAELVKRRDVLNRWKQQASQDPSLTAGHGGQSSNNHWTLHANTGQPFDSSGQTRPPSMGLLPNQPTHAMRTSPNLPQGPAQANAVINSGLIPPRTIPTPQQQPQSISPHASTLNGMSFTKPNTLLPKGPAGSQSSMGVQGGTSMTNFVSSQGIDKGFFEANFKSFVTKRGVNLDPRLRLLENQPLDLHALHIQVMQEGGFSKIEGNDNLWSIIAARLGHVQFPGSATEPPTSGPGVAQTMQYLYKEYIVPFEAWCMTMMQDYKQQQANVVLRAALSGTHYSTQQLLQMVGVPPAELQNRGVDEKTIQLVESQKGGLQRLIQDQRVFADGVRHNSTQNIGHGDQNGGMGHRPPSMGSSPSYGSGTSQQTPQQNYLSLAGRQQLQHQLMQQQQGGQHLQSTIPNGAGAMLAARMSGQQMVPTLPTLAPMGGNTMQNFAPKSAWMNQVAAAQLIDKFKNEYAMSNLPNANVEVPIEQQVEYAQSLERLHRQCVVETEPNIGVMAVMMMKDGDEHLLKRVVTIVCAVNQQRHNLSSASGPRYIVAFDQLKAMATDLSQIHEHYLKKLQQQKQQALRAQQPPQIVNSLMAHPVVKQEMPSQSGRPVMPPNRQTNEVPQQQQPPQPPSQPQPPLNPNQSLRHTAPVSLHPPKRKHPQTPGGSAAASSPSPVPVASAPTPVANTPTPTATASSPPATKSPKAKAPGKSKGANAKQRRPSRVVHSVPVAPTAEEPKPTPPATSVTTGKRPREEESTPNSGDNGNNGAAEVVNEGSPPKRLKTEWEAQPSDTQRKQTELVANIKTDEEAAALFDQMAELIKRAAEEDGGQPGQPSSITTGISETLDMLLKGYGPVPDAMDGMSAGAARGESNNSRETDPAPTLGDPFDEFFDFSFGTVEEDDSKTPDLVSSSSTNPSPESNHDAEPRHHLLTSASSSTIDLKTEDTSDPLRLGLWKEIDGGEAAYFQTTEWKYDSPMTSYEQPWAIYNS